MADITEILRSEFQTGWFNNPGAQTAYMGFVANNAVNEIQLNTVAAAYFFVFSNAGGKFQWQARDNVLILSVWLTFPYVYYLSRPGAVVSFYRGNVTTARTLPEISPPYGQAFVPVAGAEISLGVFSPWDTGALPVNFPVMGCQVAGWVSQVGAPAGLNGTTYYPTVFVKVKHTLPLV